MMEYKGFVWGKAAAAVLSSVWSVGFSVAAASIGTAEFFNDVKVPMRDGVCLAADVYLPSNRTGKAGCWLSFSPYGATKPDRPQGVERAEEWGVAAVFADCRGLCHSEGTFEAWESRMVDDADDLLTWIAAQPWSNGKVVMTGGSYPGHTQLAAMRSGNPALVACAPSVITFEPDTINFQNGVLVTHFMRGWHSGLAGKASWEELAKHPTCDAWWRERTDRRKLAKSCGRAFYQAGWYDLLGVRTFASFKEMPAGSVLRVGPWNHGVNTFDDKAVDYRNLGGEVTEDAEIEFLRSALEGRDSESRKWPGRILLYVMGRNAWRYENEWPLARTVWRDFDFTSGETRSFGHDPKKPVPSCGGRMLGGCGGQMDQREVEKLAGVLSYTGPALAQDLEVTGDVSAKLIVSSTAACSDVAVKLVDVYPDGRAVNVVDGICRTNFTPGERKSVEFFVDVTSYVFLRGHKVRVDVAGSNSPHFEVNPTSATVTIHAGSKVVLPTIPLAGSDCGLAGGKAEPVTLASLLDEMTDRDALTRFPEPCYKMRLWSSHSRQSVAPDKPGWFANWDWNNFVREETNAVGEVERVMVDAEGPGALVRAWVTGNAAGISTLRVYVDGAAKPLFEGIVTNLVGGSAICGAPLSQGLSPATPLEKQGFNLFLPIPYARHLKVAVVMPKPKETFYYNVETRTWPAGTAVESTSKETLAAAAKKIAAVNAVLARTDEPVPDGETKAFGGTLAPGERKTVSFAGQGAIRHLQMRPVCPRDTSVYMWGDEETCVRDVEIQLAFDGVTTVKMPVGAFFNSGIWGCDYHLTRFTSVMSNLVMSSRWVMPFAKSFEMTLVNTGDRPVVLKDAKVVKGDYSWDARSMRFGATYVPRPDVPTRKKGLPYDVAFENLKGRGLVVGTSVMVDNPARCWWGEGDEKVWVDGERDPSYIGTGTEDFFCYAWCQHAPFSHPFVTQPCGDGNGDGAVYGGYAVNFRARQLDAIPFRSSIRFDMELWHWADVRVRYDTVSWHYLAPQP